MNQEHRVDLRSSVAPQLTQQLREAELQQEICRCFQPNLN